MIRHKRGPQRFLVLEVLDSEVVLFLSSLRRAFGGKERPEVHITVRGPYMEPIKGDDIERFWGMVEGSTVFLKGFGTFDNPSESVVYLRAHNDTLRKIWWKPDYPKERFGFNPHVSILKTKSRAHASEVSRFLNRQSLEFECKKFHLVPLAQKQGELFPLSPSSDNERDRWNSFGAEALRTKVVEDAASLVASYRAQQQSVS